MIINKILIYIFYCTLFVIYFTTGLFPNDIGKVIQLEGIVERSSITSGNRYPIKIGDTVRYAQRIKVGPESLLEILFNNGTSIYIKENSLVYLFNLRVIEKDPPTKLKLAYGKIKVTPKRIFNNRSLILTTQTAVISVVDARFSAVAGEYETKVLAYSSKVGVANINPHIKRAFVITEGEEVSIRKNAPPSLPRSVPSVIVKFWFDYYNVTSDYKYIIKTEKEEGFIDWLLRKREF